MVQTVLLSKLKSLEKCSQKCGILWRSTQMSLFVVFCLPLVLWAHYLAANRFSMKHFYFYVSENVFVECISWYVKKIVSFNFLNNQFYVYTIAQWKGAFVWLSFSKGFACRLHLERSCIRIANEHSEMLFCHSLFWLSWKCHCQVLWQNEKR